MKNIGSYITGRWISNSKKEKVLVNAITGDEIGYVSGESIDFKSVFEYGRNKGGRALRKMTFHERGRMLKSLALHLLTKKDFFYELSWATGATRADSWVDIEGGIGNLFANASLRRQFPDEPFCLEGDVVRLSKGGTFIGHHICVPKEGVAIHINAFNFPVWGMLEKCAVNWLAGVPAVVKPATITSYLTEAVVREIIASGILPEGALQLICGPASGILDSVINQDVVTFTGSATTGKKLKSNPRLIEESVPFNMEADSLNCCILGESVKTSDPEFEIFIKEVQREITTKAGQKCTAVRRIMVPENMIENVQIALGKRLASSTIGNPKTEGVRMGALAGKAQLTEVLEKVNLLSKSQEIIFGDPENFEVVGADKSKGAFMPPILFLNDDPFRKTDCHEIEAFGPVSTLMPYRNMDEAIELSKMGKGSLVSSIVTQNDKEAKQFVLGAACMHGRILVLNRTCAKESTGHGSPMPMLVHGGPGRAGGGEEMGGKRGVFHYLQRTAIQGSPTTITNVSNNYQYGAEYIKTGVHPFRRYFEELQIGETLITPTHTVTEQDVIDFANLSGDKFYAHLDPTSLEGTIFKRTVAHGYFILSRAAGLFVDPPKGPVLLNYGIDECRFTKPVYPGMTIGVRFTCKEKIAQEKRTEDDIPKGIVKWLVDVYDCSPQEIRDKYELDFSAGDTVAIATILTMVRMKNG
ncbi:MAG: phenylacetic acid degradation bifunctional protein PaaZ [Bacteroidia bacterium]|nr:phenylacetic acid degradation bifunctional protein PaaZ [Bacteroidia bacterium]